MLSSGLHREEQFNVSLLINWLLEEKQFDFSLVIKEFSDTFMFIFISYVLVGKFMVGSHIIFSSDCQKEKTIPFLVCNKRKFLIVVFKWEGNACVIFRIGWQRKKQNSFLLAEGKQVSVACD